MMPLRGEGRGYLSDLSLILFGRQERAARFMLLKAYFDESGVHQSHGKMVVAALAGSIRQWERLGKKMKALKKELGIHAIHATDLHHHWVVKGKAKEKWIKLMLEMNRMTQTGLSFGVVVSMSMSEYRLIYANEERPTTYRLDSPYAVCFGWCLYIVVNRFFEYCIAPPAKLVPIVEMRDGCGIDVEIYNEIRKGVKVQKQQDALRNMVFSPKGPSALEAVDVLAYSILRLEKHGPEAMDIVQGRIGGGQSQSPSQNERSHIHLHQINADDLRAYKNKLMEFDQRRLARRSSRLRNTSPEPDRT
jgi:hypothetical protein